MKHYLAVAVCLTLGAAILPAQELNGSAQEFDEACILSRFLKNDKFCFCNRHALRLEQ